MCVLERESDSKRSRGEDEACDGGGGSGGKKREGRSERVLTYGYAGG